VSFTDAEKDLHLLELARALVKAIDFDHNFGTPSIDAKRPFGDSTPECDVVRIIGLSPECPDGHSEAQYDYARKLLYEEVVPFIRKRCRLVLESGHTPRF